MRATEVGGEVVVEAGDQSVGGLVGASVGIHEFAPFPGHEIFVRAGGAVEHRDGVNALLKARVELARDGGGVVAGLDLDGGSLSSTLCGLGSCLVVSC